MKIMSLGGTCSGPRIVYKNRGHGSRKKNVAFHPVLKKT
jgi:hypothetical protein